jgi:hypothetical protein
MSVHARDSLPPRAVGYDRLETETRGDVADSYFAACEQFLEPAIRAPQPRAELRGQASCILASQREPRSWFGPLTRTLVWPAVVASLLWGFWVWQTPHAERQPRAASSRASRHAQSPYLPKRIEDVQLGERVAGTNPIRSEVDPVEPDAESWRRVSLVMAKENGGQLEIELLRPATWIEANDVRPGYSSFLSIPEMGAVGQVDVVAVGPCPSITPGTAGAIVTGRFIHECRDANVIRIQIDGQAEAIGVTDNHRYWSFDRQSFIAAGCLKIGELVDTVDGERRVVSIEPFAYSGLLYNLETTEHVYRVGSLGTLVHNACKLTPYAVDDGHHIFAKSAFKGLKDYDERKALSIGASELARLSLTHRGVNGMTSMQQRLFRELAASGRPNTLEEHATIAIKALIAGGLRSKEANRIVAEALDQLKSWGITAPIHIPWG